MRGNGKRIITLILSLAMVLSIFSPVLAMETDLNAFTAEVFQDEDEQEDEQETEEQDDEEIQAPEPVTPEPEPLPEPQAADMDSTSVEEDELGFQLINWVFDYGQDVIAVAIDAGAAVDGGTVDEDTFTVSAVNTSPVDGATTFEGERNITAVYVNSEANVSANRNQASGRYIIIELETGIDLDNGSASVNGATTLIYTGGSNHVLEMDYSIEQNETYSLASGGTVEAGEYVQDEVQINLIVDDFEKGEYEGQLYRLFTPEDTSEPQPLVLWLHGGGESGDNNESQLRANQGGVAWALPENQAERPAYVLAPQASERWATAAERARVKGIIDELIADGSVDPDRIYISGCSMGGAGTWYMLDDYPDLFAAAIMAPASADRTAEQLMPLRHIAIWLVHTGTDSWPGIENTYNRMTELGGNVRYTRFPGGVNYNGHTNDHHSWMPMLNNEYIEEYETDFMSWLFEQVKGESADGMIVDTAYGRMQGAAHSGDYAGITSFRGVPYAAAPVGELRFAPPQDPASWDGVYDATKYADIVMQPGSDTESEPWLSDFYADGTPAHTGDMSEDGLYLNITTSYNGTGESDRPVFIWFHGGGLNHGYSYEIEFNGEELAKKGVVVVTVGHRLNAFGYLALPQLTAEQGTSGNYGLMDQFKALDWIEENIAAFGGDADNITIGGQSGGSSKSMAMAISPYNNGRIKNVIMQSGIQHSTTYRTMEAHYQYGQRLLANLGLSADATLEELRAVDAADIIRIGNPAGAGTNSMVKDDDYIIYASVQEAIADGALDGINILGGRNYGEGSHTSTISTAEQFYNQMQSTFGDLYDESVFESLGVTDDTAKDQYRIVNTLVQNMDYRMFGNDYTAQTGGDLYVYQFGRFTPSLPEEAGTFRDQNNLWAWHSSELWYTFASLRTGVPAVRPWEDYDFQLADTMSTYWSNFMKTGNPNGDGLAYWPKTSENLGYMELGLNNEEVGVTGLEPGLDRLLAARTNQRYGYSMPGDQDEYDFQLINWVFDYGQDVIAVAIDAGAAVDGGTVDLDTFAVSARNISAYSGDVTYDGERNITAVYVNSEANVSDNQNQASGRYIIIELETGIDLDNGSASVNGATTLSYEGGFNHPLLMNYSIKQNEAYSMASGETVDAGAYVQNETQINLIVDEFDYGQEDDLIYRLFTPEDTSEPQPLVLWLHGSGERLNPGTNDNEAPIRANMGGVAWALPENQAERPAYVLVPQAQAVAPDGRWSATERATIIKVIDQMIKDGRVDANRVYVSGCSMGGTGTWNTIIDYPNYFAAAIMAPASGDIDGEILMTLRHLPIWLVHTGTDSWPGIENTYNRMTELGGIIRYTRFPGGVNYNGHTNDHHSWMPMLNNEYIEEYETDFMSWLFEQVRQPVDEVDVDKSALEALIAATGTLNRSDYTSASWIALQEALSDAGETLRDDDATQDEVDKTVEMLKKAIDNLERATTTPSLSSGNGNGGNSGWTSPSLPSSFGGAALGASGASSNVGSDGAVNQATITTEASTALSSTAEGGAANVKVRNATSISAATLQALSNAAATANKSLVLYADTTTASGAVQGRLYVELGKVASDLQLAVYTEGNAVNAIKARFGNWFSNKLAVVSLGQKGSFGARLQIAAKLDLTGLDTENLYLYSYDSSTNTYSLIADSAYTIDANGYLRFYTAKAGDIIISEGALVRK